MATVSDDYGTIGGVHLTGTHDDTQADGAILSVTATNGGAYPVIVWATYRGTTYSSPTIQPGGSYTVDLATLTHKTIRAGDVTAIGVNPA